MDLETWVVRQMRARAHAALLDIAAIRLLAANPWVWAPLQYEPGCDCDELCSMGPTCPGGILARLPGSGCWRTGRP